jgi:FAD reductase [NAD(P)H]
MKKITVIQSSLREGSNTAIVCRAFAEKCDAMWLHVHYVDLKDVKMDLCDARPLENYSDDIQNVYSIMEGSEAVVFGMPVYQYTMSGVLKNFIDICGWAVAGKPVGVIINSGWPNTYMASRDLFDCLYYEYACTNLAPTPFTWSMDFKEGKIVNDKVLSKLDELAVKIISL